jgi:polar amino acid transport system permease protein
VINNAGPANGRRIVRRRNWPEIGLGVVIAVVVAALVWVVGTSDQVRWQQVAKYIADPAILSGVGVTIFLTVVTFVLSTLLGSVLAVMRVSKSKILLAFSGGYIWVFRGTPLLVQLVLWYNIALFIPHIGLFGLGINTNDLISPFTAAILGLWLNVSAYMCEVIRGGIVSVDRGQTEAALAIGMTARQTMLRVVFPQAVRVILPPAGNLGIDLLKATSLVSVIGARDLLTNAKSIFAQNYYVIELLFVTCAWYLLLVTIATVGQSWLERRYSRGYARRSEPGGPRMPERVASHDGTGRVENR